MAAATLDCSQLQALSVAPLHESDNLLLYLVILALYKEGVRPTYSEVHYKLKEYQSPWDVERSFLVYYLLQPQRYILKIGTNVLESNVTVARQLLTQHMSRSRSRKSHSPVSSVKPFQATDVLIYFREEPAWFKGWVNLKDGENHYSLRSWSVLVSFFFFFTSNESVHSLTTIFKQTRYSLAKSLKALGPPEIRDMRLGEIAHMAQLAIQHGFLCYEANTIQPTWTSYTLASMKSFKLNLKVLPNDSEAAKEIIQQYSETSKTKEGKLLDLPQCQNWKTASEDEDQQSTTVSSTFKTTSPRCELPPLSDIQELRLAVKKLLSLEDCGQILLSQLRVILQARMHINLVPWTLGYAKLSNLLIAECSDVCRLVRHGGRHVFVEACVPSQAALEGDKSGEGRRAVRQTSSETSAASPLNSPSTEVSKFANLSSRIHSSVPLYFLDYSPQVLDYVIRGGTRADTRDDWRYADVEAIGSKLRGCRLSVLFHGLPVSIPPSNYHGPSSFDDLLSIDWHKDQDPPALLLASLID
eukprot:Gregarina_sp_Pseudo_9__374@NODE_1242_length_1746_cov_176_554774_g1168_i0_p1_GENE_NODE_1242_length_1746_cov_176_554774_g1168_i0NODE_1242_length_1746_cov_176_554774_g1168_i0_p1_ORF_typecomplete_len527_score57_32OHA/PF14418_6/3_9e16OSTHTH/PF12872_7/0_0012_NODE_1242_length_1746_cov_176_554774_g1168_i0621642